MTNPQPVRVRASDLPVGRPRGLLRRLAGIALYPVFQTLLLIPAVRRWRRAPWWNRVRFAALLGGAALGAAGGRFLIPAAGLLLAAAWLAPLPDPDRLRKVAEQLGAQHTLNGGLAASGLPLLLFVSPQEVLLAGLPRPERILARYSLPALDAITLDGRPYQPRYVSFAKEPPRLDEGANPDALAHLTLRFGEEVLALTYRGVFALHLAEVAARTLQDLRRLAPQGSQPAEQLPVIP